MAKPLWIASRTARIAELRRTLLQLEVSLAPGIVLTAADWLEWFRLRHEIKAQIVNEQIAEMEHHAKQSGQGGSQQDRKK